MRRMWAPGEDFKVAQEGRNATRIVTGILAPTMGAEYYREVRVLARGTLEAFVKNRVPRTQRGTLKAQLDAWYEIAMTAGWSNSAELKKQVGSASVLSSERVVFNIKGNDYRLIAAINYEQQIMFVKWLGTHEEYDRIDAREVNYDEDRYLG